MGEQERFGRPLELTQLWLFYDEQLESIFEWGETSTKSLNESAADHKSSAQNNSETFTCLKI